ncbi:DivIVA domain-containing protein [Calidifontibacter terrae]
MTPVAWTPDHIATVRQAQLPVRRGGYHPDDVDRWIDHVVALMNAGREVPTAASGLRRTGLREGYSVEAVDALFGHIAGWQQELRAAQTMQAETVRSPVAAVTKPVREWTPQQMDWVRESNFRPARGKRGYAEGEVDSFLDDVLLAMGKGEELPDVDSVRFYPPRAGRSGYEALSVDRFLDELKRLRPIRG